VVVNPSEQLVKPLHGERLAASNVMENLKKRGEDFKKR